MTWQRGQDEALLSWYYRDGLRTSRRSPMGAMLARAANLAYGSDGRRHRRRAPRDGEPLRLHETKSEASYEMDADAMIRIGTVSRRLSRMPLSLVAVLEAYYGDLGAAWATRRHGRLWSLSTLTATGRVQCERLTRSVRGDVGLSEAVPPGTATQILREAALLLREARNAF